MTNDEPAAPARRDSKLRRARKAAGVTLEDLSERTGISVSQLSRLESGTRGQRLEQMLVIARALGLEPAAIMEADPANIEFRSAPVSIPRREEMAIDLPVWGSAAGSVIRADFEGFQMSPGEAIDYVRRPPALASVPDAYAVYVIGDSMAPMHSNGDLRMVHPHRPPSPGDTVIVQTKHWEHDPGQGYIKILRRRNGDRLVLEQLNPKATIEIPLKYVVSVHKVMDMNDLFGV